jgi:hypothetical protein
MFLTRGHETSTAKSSHGKFNVFTGGHDTITAMSRHGHLNVFDRAS